MRVWIIENLLEKWLKGGRVVRGIEYLNLEFEFFF